MAKKPKRKASAKPAAKPRHAVRFPNEGRAYRAARAKLLDAEIKLRRQVEVVAALRRELPPGGSVPEDYVFEEGSSDPGDTQTARSVRMSELFSRDGSLLVYSYMYGPAMAKPCPMCTSILDSLDGAAKHVGQRMNIVVVAKSPIQRIRELARARGWRNLRLLSSAGNTYNRDYRGEDAKGSQMPALNVFTRKDGKIRHSWCSELMFVTSEPGQDPRHVDIVWPLWNLFDLAPEGRGTGWRPKLEYGA